MKPPRRCQGLDHLPSNPDAAVLRGRFLQLKQEIQQLGESRDLSLALSALDVAGLWVAEHIRYARLADEGR